MDPPPSVVNSAFEPKRSRERRWTWRPEQLTACG